MTDIQNIEVSPMEHPLAGQVIALTSGGTGGHMFPAVALARALVRR
ncbi:MAG: glycosyltransferase, partial [Thalassospira sp.]|nr:glycosyltransferase [Thalassospira sp.]